MTIETKTYGTEIYADEGKAVRHKDDPRVTTTTTSVCIPLTQSAADWSDCDYGEDTGEATEADKDAALTTLGVDMTEANQ